MIALYWVLICEKGEGRDYELRFAIKNALLKVTEIKKETLPKVFNVILHLFHIYMS